MSIRRPTKRIYAVRKRRRATLKLLADKNTALLSTNLLNPNVVVFEVVLLRFKRLIHCINDSTIGGECKSGDVFVDRIDGFFELLREGCRRRNTPTRKRQQRCSNPTNENCSGLQRSVSHLLRAIFRASILMEKSSRSRMRRLVCMAARRLPRGELHHFHARAIGIERIDAVLAVAPDFRTIKFLPAALFELCRRDIRVFDAEGKVILLAHFLVIGVRRNVQHVLDPVVAVRHLKLKPIDIVVFKSAIPIGPKSKDVAVELVLRGSVLHNVPGVNHSASELLRRNLEVSRLGRSLYEGDAIALWILYVKTRGSALIRDCASGYAVRKQVATQSVGILGRECNFSDPIPRRRRGNWLEFDILFRVHCEARPRIACAISAARWKPQYIAVKRAGLRDVADVEAHVVDASDLRPRGCVLPAR